MDSTATDPDQTIEAPRHENRAYIAKDELTGLPVIVMPPGTPPLTSERVRTWLKDFP